jgi:hypothetical protein
MKAFDLMDQSDWFYRWMLLFYVMDVSVSFYLAMSRASMWGGLQCESVLHVYFIRVQFVSYPWSPCIWRTSKSEVIRVMCMNLKTRWSWTLNWKQTWKLNKTWLIICHEYFMEWKYCMSVGTQLNIFHATKLSIWLNYVKFPSTKKKIWIIENM